MTRDLQRMLLNPPLPCHAMQQGSLIKLRKLRSRPGHFLASGP